MQLSRPDRHHAIEDEHAFAAGDTVQELGLVTSVLECEALGFFFDMDKAIVSRNTKGVLSVFRQIGGDLGLERIFKAQGVSAAVA
jgi:hypothetical protein